MIDIHRRELVLGLGLSLGLVAFRPLHAADPRPKAFWVEINPTVPNSLIVTVDTSNVPRNFYFENVELVLGMYDINGQRIGVQALPVGLVTSAGWTYLIGARGLQRHATSFRPEEMDPRTAWIRGDTLRWANRGAMGGKSDAESPWFDMQPRHSPYIGFAPLPH